MSTSNNISNNTSNTTSNTTNTTNPTTTSTSNIISNNTSNTTSNTSNTTNPIRNSTATINLTTATTNPTRNLTATTVNWLEHEINYLINQRRFRNVEYHQIIGRNGKREFWSSVARRMHRELGSDFTGRQCNSKFQNLVSTYYVSEIIIYKNKTIHYT